MLERDTIEALLRMPLTVELSTLGDVAWKTRLQNECAALSHFMMNVRRVLSMALAKENDEDRRFDVCAEAPCALAPILADIVDGRPGRSTLWGRGSKQAWLSPLRVVAGSANHPNLSLKHISESALSLRGFRNTSSGNNNNNNNHNNTLTPRHPSMRFFEGTRSHVAGQLVLSDLVFCFWGP